MKTVTPILLFTAAAITNRGHSVRRRCRFTRPSLHVYRFALLRRLGIVGSTSRPAMVFNNLTRALLRARTQRF